VIARYVYLAWMRHRLRRYIADGKRAREIQRRVLLENLQRHAASDFGRDHGFSTITSTAEFRARVPIRDYDDLYPYIARVIDGDTSALFAPGTRVLMFTMTSGTTGVPKRLPITEQMFRDYRLGWLIWGGGVFGDYPHLFRYKTLQLTSDWQQSRTPHGAPCGQISGLAATSRPKVGQLLFLPPVGTDQIHDHAAKHYTVLRFALATERVGMIITANPSTLIEIARRAERQSAALVRDIFDGTLSCDVPAHVRQALSRRIGRRRPKRARELEQLITRHGSLLPKHAWPKLSHLGVWTGGALGVFLPRLEEWYGSTVIRDHGLSASEGRMTIPVADGTAAGLLDFCHSYFEFMPVGERGSQSPIVLEAHELELGRDYFILLTTSGGLYRYDIQDVVRCVGFEGQSPMLEFLNKGKNTSNLTGEKLSEFHVVRAVEESFRKLSIPNECFTLAPVLENQPRYVLLLEPGAHRDRVPALAASVQLHLERINEEYAAKCADGRLLPVEIREVPRGTWDRMRQEKSMQRGNFEEYKHPCIVGDLTLCERLMATRPDSTPVPDVVPLVQPAPTDRTTHPPAAA
jgi:hypothetical protein